MGKLVQHPRLAQRVGGLQKLLIQHAELAGVESVEGADRRDLLFGIRLGHGTPSIFAIVKYIVAFGNYILVGSALALCRFYFAWGCFRYFESGPAVYRFRRRP